MMSIAPLLSCSIAPFTSLSIVPTIVIALFSQLPDSSFIIKFLPDNAIAGIVIVTGPA